MINQGVTAALAARDANKNTNGDDSHILGAGVRRTEQTAHECTYTNFLKCQPLNFKGTEGVAGLSQWFERMESVFHISNYTIENQVKFATCTLHLVALTWWNTHVKTVGHDAAYESDKIEKYVDGLPDMIHGSVVASKPKTMQDVVEIATELMDKKIRTFAKCQTERSGEKKPYRGSKPLCENRQLLTLQTTKGQLGQVHKPTCYECGVSGTFLRGISKAEETTTAVVTSWRGSAPTKSVAVGIRQAPNPDSNFMMGTDKSEIT
ncbi:hypothetical protein Tco_0564872 [Tanacetum coccineum]